MATRPKLLVVEDDVDVQRQMKWGLNADYEVLLAADRVGAIARFEEHQPVLVTLDLGLPPQPWDVGEGFAALATILERDPDTKVIVVTGREDREHALKAVARGAHDYFGKPLKLDELRVILRRALYMYELEHENRSLRSQVESGAFEQILGHSPAMDEVVRTIGKVAKSEAPVLILGESGSGKELVARALHRRSCRGDGPFVPINCGAIPDSLVESELFGHEKGSFTGADRSRSGRIETAHGGTLFLDEVGELPPPLQVKLLRFLQEGSMQRIGARGLSKVDARVIAATNADLQEALAQEQFREDLYYRLAVVEIRIPPLRERGDDVILLANALLERHARQANRRFVGFTDKALAALLRHGWPGNVRELDNCIRRAVIKADSERVAEADLELPAAGRYDGLTLDDATRACEREIIGRALQRHSGNLSRAVKDLDISRPTLYDKMKRLGLSKEEFGRARADRKPGADGAARRRRPGK